ncbi:hypothetical protein LVD13_04900 [Flavobacteriaceae bacterium D16]|nr:hypothetical protein [Flavobacteriaceae bacterium D16]
MKKEFYLTRNLGEASGAPPGNIHPKDTCSSTLTKDLFPGLTAKVQQSG